MSVLLEECGGGGVGSGQRGRGGCTDGGGGVNPMSISSTAAGCDASSATYESSFEKSKWRREGGREGVYVWGGETF